MFFKSLISRVIILNILLLSIGIGMFTMIHLWRERNHQIESAKESAQLLLSTIENSIFNSMRVGNSEEVQAILEMVGRSRHLMHVRIFKPDGTILRSSHPPEIGEKVNSSDLQLFLNDRRDGIFSVDGEESLSIVKPIVSDLSCFRCHGEGHKVLGVLNLNYSLIDTVQKLTESSQFFLLSTVLIICLLSVGVSYVLVYLVKRPMQNIAKKMAQVQAGNLSVRMVPQRDDEMGSLMRSFNSMVVNLEKANNELEEVHYKQMERVDRLASVGEMATGIAHEIKNPLAGISSAISVLSQDFEDGEPSKEIINKVLEQIGRLDKTATDLLYFGRPGKPEFSYADINTLVKKTLFFVSQHPESKNIHRDTELTRDLPLVWVDEKQVQQVLFNVIINAVQAMPGGGSLRVQTDSTIRDGQQYVQVAIGDSGEGIPPEKLEKIFAPFYTSKTQGTGLGLPICRKLMEQHGGTISVESQIGKGTVFTIELPVVTDPAVKGNEEESAQR